MRQIPSTQPPARFNQLRGLRADFGEYSSDKTIRQALWDQQDGLCAYCERRLKKPSDPDHRTRIEHFHPQGSSSWTRDCQQCSGGGNNNDAPTTWTNLLLCCDGNERARQDFTCDKLKSNTDVCTDFRNPKTWGSGTLVVIDKAGIALAASGLPSDGEKVINEVLNLNAKHLVDVRKTILRAWRKEIIQKSAQQKGLSGTARSQIILRIRTEASKKEYPSTLLSLADTLER